MPECLILPLRPLSPYFPPFSPPPHVQVWFPQDWASILGATGQPALMSFTSMLQLSPQLLFAGAQAAFPFFNTAGLAMGGSTIDMPSGNVYSGDPFVEAEILTLNNSYSYGDYSYRYSNDGHRDAQVELLRLAAADGPPIIWIEGLELIETLEYSPFADDSAVAYDTIDGFIPISSTTYQLCSIPESMQGTLHRFLDDRNYSIAMDFTQLNCFASSGSLDTNIASNLSQVNVH